MEVVFSSKKVEKQCTDLTAAKKLVEGDDAVARGLLARINMFKQAVTIKDIIVQKQLHFHKLNDRGRKKLDGYFAIDVKGRRSPWRLIIQPLDDEGNPFIPCNIDEIADIVRVVGIEEASKHYE